MTRLLKSEIFLSGGPVRLFFAMFVLLCTTQLALAQTGAKVTINVQDAPVKTTLEILEKESGLKFTYDDQVMRSSAKVTLAYTQEFLSVVLDDFSKQTSFKYEIKRDGVVVFAPSAGKGGKFVMSGVVKDDTGETIIGATVSVSGTSRGVRTDIDGNYKIEVAPGELISFSYVGMRGEVIKADPKKQVVNVDLRPNDTLLEEVVVTGYQTLSKERATGAYSVISDKQTKGKLNTDVLSRIEGLVAGINKTNNGADDIVIRGITTINGEQKPLYIVDGMPYQGSLDAINPTDIQNITVLKDATASSIYGARAANGVIVISTKRGKEGKLAVNYNMSAKFVPKADLSYLNLLNSSELVDLEIAGFKFYHPDQVDNRRSLSPVTALLYKHKAGELTDAQLADGLNVYRNTDNRRQIEDEFARTGLVHQHNLSLSGGSKSSRYIASLNYLGDYGNQRFQSKDRIGFNLKNDMDLTDWFTLDVGVSGSFVRNQGDNGISNYSDFLLRTPSYYALRDHEGNEIEVPLAKSRYEIDRLKSIGLLDETFYPISNRSQQNYVNAENYFRLHSGMRFKIAEGLSLDLKYQSENIDIKDRQYYSPNSYYVRNMINDAAQYNAKDKKLVHNVPTGGQLRERYSKSFSYTMRSQVNFSREFGKHNVTMLGGAERRLIRTTVSNNLYFGYDDSSLATKPINPIVFRELKNTESLSGSFSLKYEDFAHLIHNEDRFISFYANGSYTYDNRYSVTGSLRIDQSNLFGTDPKLQYRPLWSLGASWYLGNEGFMKDIDWIDQLNLRLTSGVGGNIPKNVGPYLNVQSQGLNVWSNEFGSRIVSPPNAGLRWEKTTSNNLGIDFAFLNSRLSGSVDFYYKSTTDLLGEKSADPTLGWQTLTLNYGSMVNKGMELSLQATLLKRKNFSWTSNLILSYNDNKLTNLSGTKDNVFTYTSRNVEAIGYPVNSLFSYRYAGLSDKDGSVLVYDGQGNKVSDVSSISELVYSGTRDPKVTSSLRNVFTIGDFDLSFMFVYYGGHVMRDVVADYLPGAPSTNINKKILNMWTRPGDETKSDVTPGFKQSIGMTPQQALSWYSADIHVKKADYIKLRDVSVSYNIPKEWLKKLSLQSATLTCQVSNPWWWAANGDVDPEAYGTGLYGRGLLTLPTPTTYTLGLSLNF